MKADSIWLRTALAAVLLYFPVCGLPGMPFGNGGRYANVLAGPLALLYLLASCRSDWRRMAADAWSFVAPFLPLLAACALVLVAHPEAEVGDPFSRVLWTIPIVLAARRIGVTRSAVFSAAALGAVGYLVAALVDVLVYGAPRAGVKVNGVIFAETASLCAGLALFAAVHERSGSLARRAGWLAAGLAGLIAVAMSGSRGPLLATLWLALVLGVSARRHAVGRTATVAVFAVALVLTLAVTLTPISDRVPLAVQETADYYSAAEPTLTSVGIRLQLWKIALASLPEHWLFGYGYSTLEELAPRLPALGFLPDEFLKTLHHFHADWAHALMAGGIVLVAGVLATMAALFWQARSDGARLWLVAAMLVFGLTDLALFRKPTFTLFVASYGLLLVARNHEDHGPAPRSVPG